MGIRSALPALALSAAACLGVAVSELPVLALDADQIRVKFSEIVVLAPVSKEGGLRSLPALGFVAALSPTAAAAVQQRWLASPEARQGSRNLDFKRMNLIEFEDAAMALRQGNNQTPITYIPDPEQQDIAGELLQQQGVQAPDALKRAATEVFAFCPEPLVRITTSSANTGRSTVVPCGLDFTTIAILVNRANVVGQTRTVIKAYSLPELLAFLDKQSGPDAENLKILPMPWVLDAQSNLGR